MKETLIERLSRNMLVMGQYLVGEMFTSKSAPFHVDLDRRLRDLDTRRTVIVSPRGHAKSSVAACLLVIWHLWFEDTYRRLLGLPRLTGPKFVVLTSKTKREAQKRLDTVKRILGDQGMYSKQFRKMFGDWGENTSRLWNRDEVILKDGSMIQAMGTGQQARGLKSGHARPTLIVADDPEDENNTRTANSMHENKRWLLQALMPSLDERVGRIVVIGTPINTQCMVVTLKDSVGWRCLWYRNDVASGTSSWFDSATREWVTYGDVLWPGHMPRKRLEEQKAMALSMGMVASYYREYEAVVVGDEDQIFKPALLKSWFGEWDFSVPVPWIKVTRRRGTEVEEKKVPVARFCGVDPASSTAARADKTAIVNIAVDSEDNIYVLPGIHRRLLPHLVVEEIARNHKWLKPTRGIIEVSQAFAYIPTYLRRDHQITGYIPDRPIQKKVGEGSRIEALQPLFQAGKIWIWEDPSIWDVAKQQLLAYPRGKDDWIDAFEKACRIRRPAWHGPGSAGKSDEGGPRLRDPMLS